MTFNIDAKRQGVLDQANHCLVLGGPGSGKTTLALMKAVGRVSSLGPGQSILFLSFSRAAVGRISDAIKKNELSSEARSALSLQTFHSFFWQLIKAHGYLLGAPRRLEILVPHDEKAMRDGIDATSHDWPQWVEKRLALFKTQGRVSFDLFAPLACELLEKSERIRRRVSACYPLIIVDEAQDTSSEQWTCVKLLAPLSQIVCLADLDQMIFDYLPGVGAQRIAEIREALTPFEADLGSDNNRSPGTEILQFARDILNGHVRGGSYVGVSRQAFHPSAANRDMAIRQSVGIIRNRIRTATGSNPDNIAILASYGGGVTAIAAALRQDEAIPHQVLFDEAVVLLSSRFGAYLLEPKVVSLRQTDLAHCLALLADAQRAKGGTSALQTAGRFAKWAEKLAGGVQPKVKLVSALDVLLTTLAATPFSGSPGKDWLHVKRQLRASGDPILVGVAGALDYLVAFNRAERISTSLAELWRTHGSYLGARLALDNALAQEQLLSAGEAADGIHVMNMHKAKGKQFDGVVLYRSQYSSPFVWREEAAPHAKSRKLLHVAISRAKKHVLILDEAFPVCTIVGPHQL